MALPDFSVAEFEVVEVAPAFAALLGSIGAVSAAFFFVGIFAFRSMLTAAASGAVLGFEVLGFEVLGFEVCELDLFGAASRAGCSLAEAVVLAGASAARRALGSAAAVPFAAGIFVEALGLRRAGLVAVLAAVRTAAVFDDALPSATVFRTAAAGPPAAAVRLEEVDLSLARSSRAATSLRARVDASCADLSVVSAAVAGLALRVPDFELASSRLAALPASVEVRVLSRPAGLRGVGVAALCLFGAIDRVTPDRQSAHDVDRHPRETADHRQHSRRNGYAVVDHKTDKSCLTPRIKRALVNAGWQANVDC